MRLKNLDFNQDKYAAHNALLLAQKDVEMQIESKLLIDDLRTRTEENLLAAQELLKLPEEKLQQKNKPEAWNALECVAHLNRYGNFYLPEIEMRLNAAKKSNPQVIFKSGWLGNKFALMMLPGAKGMSTFKEMNTLNGNCTKADLDEFIHQQQKMLALLKRCENANIGTLKTSISISKFIKLKLGDSLRVVIYHNQRHLLQAQKAASF